MPAVRGILLCVVALLCASVVSADVSITASVSPAEIAVGNDAILTVRLEGKFRKSGSPELPELNGITVYESGTSQNFSFVNGQSSTSVEYHYTLRASREGTYKIDPIRVVIGDKEYTADPVTIEVTAAQQSIPSPASDPGDGVRAPSSTDPSPGPKESIFISASVDKDTVYVNQQITWTLGYYSDGRVTLMRSPNYSPPDADGFWVEDLPPQKNYYTKLGGRQFVVTEIKRAYFPAAPGVQEIGKARVDVVLRGAEARSVFDDFFRNGGFGQPKNLYSDVTRIVVLPLPQQGRPENFSGIVAHNLSLAVSAHKQLVQVGEPVNIAVEINGTGNIRTIPQPELPATEKYKVYESGSSSDAFKRDYTVTGRKQYDYVVIPQVEGKWEIPAIELTYFDPIEKRYRVASSYAVPLDVEPGAVEEGRKVVYAGGGDDFEVISRDIRFIHSVSSTIVASRQPFYRSRGYIGLNALPLLAIIASLFVERRRRKFADDIGYARSTRARREAEKKLDAARKQFRAGDHERGFALIASATTGYFADKMNAPAAGLTVDAVTSYLSSHGVGEDPVASVRDVFNACDAARYASDPVSADRAEEIVDKARAAVSSIEREFKA